MESSLENETNKDQDILFWRHDWNKTFDELIQDKYAYYNSILVLN